ncbi:MAG: LLM class F420-dependent oxidoreductase, partial [Dehalococcoidia bacterium]
MKFGVFVTQIGPAANRETITTVARQAEELGYDAINVTDHLIFPTQIRSPYPYTPERRFLAPTDAPYMESLTLLSFLAACTERIRLATSVLVLPQRHPVEVARMFACIDVLSGGRVTVGIGSGWLAEEFALLGVPFERRGYRTNEYIQLLKVLWTEDDPRFQGEFYSIAEARFAPKPVQKPHPPIWIGGHSRMALERAGRFADGWLAVDVGDQPLGTVVEQFKMVQRYAREHGRDPNAITANILAGAFFNPDDGVKAALERM